MPRASTGVSGKKETDLGVNAIVPPNGGELRLDERFALAQIKIRRVRVVRLGRDAARTIRTADLPCRERRDMTLSGARNQDQDRSSSRSILIEAHDGGGCLCVLSHVRNPRRSQAVPRLLRFGPGHRQIPRLHVLIHEEQGSIHSFRR